MTKPRHRERPADKAQLANDHNTSLSEVRMKLEYRAIESLQPAARQVRRHSEKKIGQMSAAIRRLGCLVPIIVDRDGRIIDGHAVWLACREAGLTEVPVVQHEHLNEAEVSAAKLSLNAFSLKGEWDWAAVAAEFQMLESTEVDFDLSLTGFDTPKIDWVVAQVESANDQSEADDAPVALTQGPPVTRSGDCWLIGDAHRLCCGDAREASVYARLMDGVVARMVFSDAPYNVPIAGFVSGLGKTAHGDFAMACGEMSSEEFTAFLANVNANLAAHSAAGSVHFQSMDHRHMREMLAAGHAHYSQLLNLLVWNKGTGGMGSMWRSAHELIFAWKAGTGSVINNVELGKNGRYRTNVLDYPGMSQFSRERKEALSAHPTVKPVALVHDLILDVTHRGDAVLDPFSGSGTTILAAHRAGRKGYGIELSPAYVDAALRRIEARTGLTAVLVETGETFEEVKTRRAAAAASVDQGVRHG